MHASKPQIKQRSFAPIQHLNRVKYDLTQFMRGQSFDFTFSQLEPQLHSCLGVILKGKMEVFSTAMAMSTWMRKKLISFGLTLVLLSLPSHSPDITHACMCILPPLLTLSQKVEIAYSLCIIQRKLIWYALFWSEDKIFHHCLKFAYSTERALLYSDEMYKSVCAARTEQLFFLFKSESCFCC